MAKKVLVTAREALDSVAPEDADIGYTDRSVVFYTFCHGSWLNRNCTWKEADDGFPALISHL